MGTSRVTKCAIGAVLVLLASAAGVHGSIIIFTANYEFSGTGVSPEGTAPWLTVTIDDGVNDTDGIVTLTFQATNLTGSEYVDKLYLNLDPILDPTKLQFTSPVQTGTFELPGISKDVNAYKADGDGEFDIEFSFATVEDDRFGADEAVKYTVSGIAGLTADSFDFPSNPKKSGDPSFPFAAHVNSIGPGAKSGWVSTPEPATMALMAAGFGLIAVRRRR